MKAYRVLIAVVTVGLLLTGKVLAGGAYNIWWDNDGSYAASGAALYTDINGTTLLSGGDANTAGDGYLIQLVAIQGSTNYVLKAMTIGDNYASIINGMGLDPTGYFDAESAIASNVLAGAAGSPVGIVVYLGTTTSAASGLIYNNSVTVPSPNWVTPPSSDVYFELDYTDANFVASGNAARTLDSITVPGFYIIPEPSTMMLVGLGLLGAVGLMRRRRS